MKLPPPPCAALLVLQSLHKLLPSTTLYCKACAKHFPVLLRTAKLAQSTFQYFFVLQSLQTILPGATSYYKVCTKYKVVVVVVLVLVCSTKLAQSTPQTSYYKACRKHVPVLLRTTKLPQGARGVERTTSTTQYYFVLQSLHTGREGARGQTVLLRTTQLARKRRIRNQQPRGGREREREIEKEREREKRESATSEDVRSAEVRSADARSETPTCPKTIALSLY